MLIMHITLSCKGLRQSPTV